MFKTPCTFDAAHPLVAMIQFAHDVLCDRRIQNVVYGAFHAGQQTMTSTGSDSGPERGEAGSCVFLARMCPAARPSPGRHGKGMYLAEQCLTGILAN